MAWYNSNWTYRKQVTLPASQVDSVDQSNFPVPLEFASDSDLSANAQSNGDDILFTESDGSTKLDHYIVDYDGGTGTLHTQVKIPTLSASSDTVIYIYYGNGGAANQENQSGTYSNGFSSTAHLNEGTGTSIATAIGPDYTLTQSDGWGSGFWAANAYVFDGTDDRASSDSAIDAPDTEASIEWLWQPDTVYTSTYAARPFGSDDTWEIAWDSSDVKSDFYVSAAQGPPANQTWDTNTWYHCAYRVNGSTEEYEWVVNGTVTNSGTWADINTTTGPNATDYMGDSRNQGDYTNFTLEFRHYHSTDKGNEWFTTTYNFLSTPGGITIGSEETEGAAPAAPTNLTLEHQ